MRETLFREKDLFFIFKLTYFKSHQTNHLAGNWHQQAIE